MTRRRRVGEQVNKIVLEKEDVSDAQRLFMKIAKNKMNIATFINGDKTAF